MKAFNRQLVSQCRNLLAEYEAVLEAVRAEIEKEEDEAELVSSTIDITAAKAIRREAVKEGMQALIGRIKAMEAKDLNKKIEKGHREKRHWKMKSAEGGTLKFTPTFMVSEETKEVECRVLEMSFSDAKGKETTFTFDWLNVFQFVYFTANEELRRQLASRHERQASFIPYDLTIPVTPEDARVGHVKRRVELPVDELAMAVAREEAWKILLRNKGNAGDPSAFIYKKNKR